MKLHPFSSHERGMFVSIDGPSGAGKSTIVRHLAQMLVAVGENVHVTAEPSEGPIGALCRELTETVGGHALACLYAADRYHHVETEIRPLLAAGKTVISDRYVASGLVMQRLDGLDPAFLWQLNADADRPDLAVILEADPETIAERLNERGPHNRFQLTPGSSYAEVHFYHQATERLIQAGFDMFRVDCNRRQPEQVAACITVDSLVIEVWDRDPSPPVPRQPEQTDEAGRGLLIVAALCGRWHYFFPESAGKAVWGELVIPAYDLLLSGLPRRQQSRLALSQQADCMPDAETLERVLEGLRRM